MKHNGMIPCSAHHSLPSGLVYFCCRGLVSTSGLAASVGVHVLAQQDADVLDLVDDAVDPVPTADLQAENDRLRKLLQQAKDSSQQWQQLHAELHSACVSELVNKPG